MSAKEIRDKKQELEKEISKLLNEFIKDNDVILTDIEFITNIYRIAPDFKLQQSNIKVALKMEI